MEATRETSTGRPDCHEDVKGCKDLSSKYLVVRAFRVKGSSGDMGVSTGGANRVFYINLFVAYFVNIPKFPIYPSSTL
jgi:hypothetical protein